MLTAAQAKDLLAKFINETFPEGKIPRWFAAINTVVLELLQHAEAVVEKTDKTLQVVVALANDLRVLREYAEKQGVVFPASSGGRRPQRAQRPAAPPPPQAAPEEAPAEEEIVAGDAGERVGADGAPMSPEQAALEAEMDAASGVAPVAPARRAPSARTAMQPKNGGALPLDPEARQAALEAQMDEASK